MTYSSEVRTIRIKARLETHEIPMSQKVTTAEQYSQVFCAAAGAAYVSSLVMGSWLPVFVVGIGLVLLYYFFTGLGASDDMPKISMRPRFA